MTSAPPDTRHVRFFSLEEANRQLPLVRRIVKDIMEQHGQENLDDVQQLVDELQELGCFFKGFQEGLVDWYSYYAGRPVFLCWKLGEPEIAYWHQVDAGFMGRQPVLPTQRDAFRARPAADPDDPED